MKCEQSTKELARMLWAKAAPSYKSLWHHIVDSGVCAATLASDLRFKSATMLLADLLDLTEDETIRFVAYDAAIHDCYGKAHPAFQKKSPEDARIFFEANLISKERDCEDGYRHERYGEKCFKERAAKVTSIPIAMINIIGSTIGLHHQGKHGHCKSPKVQKEQWSEMADELHRMAIKLFCPPLEKLSGCKHCDACVMLLSSFVVLADWIASSDPFALLTAETDEAYYILAQKTAEKAIAEYGLHSTEIFPEIRNYTSLWAYLSDDRLRNVQRVIMSDVCPNADLTIIEAPMGEGKTEAGAFYAARLCGLKNKQGIYFALPTSATSNQMHDRIHQMLSHIQRNEPRLMHGMAWLVQSDEPDHWKSSEQEENAQCDWLRPMRKAMLAESGVGTVDQAMMAALQIRYGCLRMLGLTGKVLVIDEIHAYDAYMSSIIERLVQWCMALQIPVVMLSATLTASKRKALVEAAGAHLEKVNQAYPLITQVQGGQAMQFEVHGTAKIGKFQFSPLRIWDDPAAIAAAALERVKDGGCLCVMMNTVSEAQRVYRELKLSGRKDIPVYLLHARMKVSQRNAVEKQCVELFGRDGSRRPEKAILVCSQIVEQSMDLDFDGMITCIAPIDLLLQRAGRVHRHVRSHRQENMSVPLIEVLVPGSIEYEAYGASGLIYEPWLLMQTHRLLPVSVNVPDGIRSVIEQVYHTPDEVSEEWARMKFKDKLNSEQAKACELPVPDPEEFFGWNLSDGVFDMDEQNSIVAAQTRLSESTARISLLSEELMEKAKEEYPSAATAREVLMNSFTIRTENDEIINMEKGKHLLRDVILICESELPVSVGKQILDYDADLGAVIRRRENA